MCLNPILLRPFYDYQKMDVSYSPAKLGELDPNQQALPKFLSIVETTDEYMLVDNQSGEVYPAFPVSCGKCYECIQKHKIEWVHRILDEASLYPQNTTVCLTYSNQALKSQVLVKKDYQDFIKRLRKYVDPVKIRYYGCGEYGSDKQRPHFHITIFNYEFPDKRFGGYSGRNFPIYRSNILERLWGKGRCTITDVNEKSLGYVTKDFQKLLIFDEKEIRPFLFMSLKPGIGVNAFDPGSLRSDKIYHNGQYTAIPKYYLRKYSDVDPVAVADVKQRRAALYGSMPDQTFQRRAIVKNKLDKLHHL